MLNQTVHLWYLVIQEADERPTLAEMVPEFHPGKMVTAYRQGTLQRVFSA